MPSFKSVDEEFHMKIGVHIKDTEYTCVPLLSRKLSFQIGNTLFL